MKSICCKIYFRKILFILLVLTIYSSPDYSQVKIMLLGDSITRDSFHADPRPDSVLTGYRQQLWFLLKSGGYNVDFVGSDSSGYGVVPKFDPDNAGFGGYTTKQLLHLLKTGFGVKNKMITPGPYLNYYPADIIVLHIGTNQLDTSSTDVNDLLNYIDDYQDSTNSLIWVILAKIINQVPYNKNVSIFNKNIEKMAEARIQRGDKLKIVDMENHAGMIYKIDTAAPYINGDMYDKLHPNKNGYKKMAALFYDTLKIILNKITPVEFAGISYIKNNQGNLLLWQTFLSLNYGFEIDKYSDDGNWDYLCFIKRKGNGHRLETYYFIDNSSGQSEKPCFYRLVLIEKNGDKKILARLNVDNTQSDKMDFAGEFISAALTKRVFPDKSEVDRKGTQLIYGYSKSDLADNRLDDHENKNLSYLRKIGAKVFYFLLSNVFVNQHLIKFFE